MTPEEVTQPYYQSVEPRPWPQSAPTRPPQQAPRRASMRWGCLWAPLGFVIGAVVTGLLALALFAVSPTPATTSASNDSMLKVTLTDALLTSELVAAQRSSGVGLASPRAHIQSDGRVVFSGTLKGTLIGSGATATIIGQLYVRDHALAFKLINATVGGVAVPPVMLGALVSQFNAQLATTNHLPIGGGLALRVSGVDFTDGAMTVSFAPVK